MASAEPARNSNDPDYASEIGLMTVSAAGHITFADDGAAQILGRDRRSLVGLSVPDAVGGRGVHEMFAALFSGAQGMRKAHVARRPDGVEVTVSLRAEPMRGESTGNAGFVVTLRPEEQRAQGVRLQRAREWCECDQGSGSFEEMIASVMGALINVDRRDTDEAIHSALERMGRLTGVDRSYLFLFSRDARTMTNTHEWCAPGIESRKEQVQEEPLERYSWFSEQIKRGEVIHLPDIGSLPAEAEAERQEFEARHIRSVFTIPLVLRNHVCGFLGFDSASTQMEWSAQHIRLLEIVGSLFSAVVERRRVEDQLEEAGRLSQCLTEISALIMSTLHPDDVLEKVVGLAQKAIDSESMVLVLKEDGEWVVRSSVGQLRARFASGRRLAHDLSDVLVAAGRGELIVSDDVSKDARFNRDSAHDLGVQAVLSVPLGFKDEIVGVMTFLRHSSGRGFSKEHEDFAERLCSLLSLALQNAKSYELTRKTLADARALGRISARISESLELDQVLDNALDEVLSSLSVAHGCIYLANDASLVVRAQRRLSEAYLESKGSIEFGDGCAGQAALTKEMFAPGPKEQHFACRSSQALLGLDCLAAIPIISKDKVLGILEMFAPVHRRLSGRERAVVQAISDQLATAIENSHLYSLQRNIAETLQETLLTVPDKITGIDFGHIYRASTAGEARAGGDFYDLFELEHGKIGLVVGDVSGKGLEAATLTSFVKNTIKAYSYQFDSPSEVLALTNKLVEKMSAPNVFVTTFFGILDKESGSLKYCNAGHPPPLVNRPTAPPRLLEGNSPAIGIFENLDYVDDIDEMGLEDTLVMYTDGVIETRCDGEFFGFDRLTDLVATLGFADTRDIPRLLINHLLEFGDSILPDDIAILTVTRSKDRSRTG